MNWSLRDEVAKELLLDFRCNREFNCEQACKKAREEADYFMDHVASKENSEPPTEGKKKGCTSCYGSGGKASSPCKKCKGSGKIFI